MAEEFSVYLYKIIKFLLLAVVLRTLHRNDIIGRVLFFIQPSKVHNNNCTNKFFLFPSSLIYTPRDIPKLIHRRIESLVAAAAKSMGRA